MKDLNILNNLNVLQKVSLGENNSILFFFGDTPDWSNKNVIYDVVEPKAYFEVIKIFAKENLTDLYWKAHRYSGERMFLEVEGNTINIWEGEISDYQEYWGAFDDLDNIEYTTYEFYTVEKTADDWQKDYEKLRKRYYSLYNKKSLQLQEYKTALQDEFKNNIESRVERLKSKKHSIDNRLLSEVTSVLNSDHSGISVIDFIFE